MRRRGRSSSLPRPITVMAQFPAPQAWPPYDPYKPPPFEYTPQELLWNPYRGQTPHPPMQRQPEGLAFFSWPSTSTVDSISSSLEMPEPNTKPKKSIFNSFRRKSVGPDGHLHVTLIHSRPPAVIYDVRSPSSAISRTTHPTTAISHNDRAQLATSPPRQRMRITCELMPWSISVSNPAGVTCGDVFDAIYKCLNRRVRRSEWLIAQESLQEKVIRAFAWRCYNAPGPPGYEEQQGPKRVDWLLKKTVFKGLSHSGEEDTWVLHLGHH